MLTAALPFALALPAAAMGFYALPMALRRLEERRLRAWCRRSRTLVLTYDDGPGRTSTPPLLDLLRTHEVRATFFIAGFRAAEHPALVDRIAAEGHEIGTHSHAHLHAWRTLPWRAAADVEHGYRSLARWVDRDGLFRPPYGKSSAWTWRQITRRGASTAWWTIDSGDADDILPSEPPAPEHSRRETGGIVLMHDFDREHRRIEFMLNSTERLLALARTEGWKVQTYGELLQSMTRTGPAEAAQCPAPS